MKRRNKQWINDQQKVEAEENVRAAAEKKEKKKLQKDERVDLSHKGVPKGREAGNQKRVFCKMRKLKKMNIALHNLLKIMID
jgi:hypothetical protein